MPSRPNSNPSSHGSTRRKANARGGQAAASETQDAFQPVIEDAGPWLGTSLDDEYAANTATSSSPTSDRRGPSRLSSPSHRSQPTSSIQVSPTLQYEQLRQSTSEHHHLPFSASSPSDLAHYQYTSPTLSSPPLRHQPVTCSSPRSAQATPYSKFPVHPPPPIAKQQSRQREYARRSRAPKPYCRSFDSLEAAGIPTSLLGENIILTGYENRLDVYAVGRKQIKIISRLNNVEGAVLSAKILPSTTLNDPFSDHRPLVALIVHRSAPSHPSEEYRGDLDPFAAECVQTSVEVWSLKNGDLVATLYKSPIASKSTGQDVASFSTPSLEPKSIGQLKIEAQGKFVVVASGLSGEVFVFAPSSPSESVDEPFRCIVKFWTSIIKVFNPARPSSSHQSDWHDTQEEQQPEQIPVFSLSDRWLAIAPPSSQSRHSIQGTVPISSESSKPIGVESVTPSAPPASNCLLDVPNPEPLTNKVARGVAKEVLKGAHWVGSQGWQAWQSYWNPSSQSSASTGASSETTTTLSFPPTHAESQGFDPEIQDKGDQVSIIDLEPLMNNSPKASTRKGCEALATFSLYQGCSFISFSPHGLLLFSVSSNGDTQFVWNLSKITARKDVSNTTSAPSSIQPIISQVAVFSRYSSTRVVDVIWSKPKNDQLAMVTERGTVHLFKLPSSPFSWPLPQDTISRRDRRTSSQEPDSLQPEAGISNTRLPLSQANPLSAAASKVSSKARPIVTTVRRTSSSGVSTVTNNLANFNVSTAAGLQGGRYLVSGVSKSLGVAAGHINQMRRASASRLSIKGGSENARPNCVRFFTGSTRGFVGAISTNCVQLHWITSSQSTPSPTKDDEIPFPDPNTIQHSHFWHSSFKSPQSRSTLGLEATTSTSTTSLSTSLHPLSNAEIETSASLQPFHAHRGISMSTYRVDEPNSTKARISKTPNRLNDYTPWVFGEDIETAPLDLSLDPLPAPDKEVYSAADQAQVFSIPQQRSAKIFEEEEPPIPDTSHEPHTSLSSMPEEQDDDDDMSIAAEDLDDSTFQMSPEEEDMLVDVAARQQSHRRL